METRDHKNPLLDQIRRMATMPQLRQMPDRELLAQFVGQRNEAAFRVLLDRYGPMVLRVYKRILGNDHDAELVRRPFRPGELALRDEVVARGQADEQGQFGLRVPADFPTWFPERQVVLVAKAPGRAPFTTLVRLAEQGATEVELRWTATERIVRGRLLTLDGAAASGVRLRVIRLGDVTRETVQGGAEHDGQDLGWPEPVVSDAEGRFTLSGIDREQGVWLQVEDDRYAPEVVGLMNTGGRYNFGRRYDPEAGLEVRLRPAQVLEGQVIAADTGKTVEGVKLTARLADPAWIAGRYTLSEYRSLSARVLPPLSFDAVSGSDGRFLLWPPAGTNTVIEVHPPVDWPYLAVWKEVDWSQRVVWQTLVVALPRGVVVRGQVVDDDGRPVAGASVRFGSPAPGNPSYRPDIIQERYRIVRTEKDGRFSLTVPTGPVRLMVHGPTHEYRPQAARFWVPVKKNPERWDWRDPIPEDRHGYTHAQHELNLTRAEDSAEVRLRLVRGETVSGRMVGPDGAPVKAAVFLCGEKVSPLQSMAVLPLSVHQGCYELPGCVAGRVYPVFFLDTVNGWGAAVDLRAGHGAGPEVKLARCGSARLRLLDGKGRPLAGRRLDLALGTERSFPADKPPRQRAVDKSVSSWFDLRHYATDPVSDADGWLTLPALIPGARSSCPLPLPCRDSRCSRCNTLTAIRSRWPTGISMPSPTPGSVIKSPIQRDVDVQAFAW